MGRSVQLRFADWYVRTFVRRESWGPPHELAKRARRIFGSPPAWAELRSFGVRVRRIDEENFRGELIEPRNPLPGAILYIHGGGYVACSPRTHRPLTAALARLSRRRVYSVDYRRAPEHPFPAAFDDSFAAYRYVVERENAPVAIGGDSAGGGLAIAIMIAARDKNLTLPACAILYSPWTDMEGSPDALENAESCSMFVPSNIDDFANAYLAGASRLDPRASPAFGDLSGLPPVLLQVGDSELLKADSQQVYDRIRASGGVAELEIWPHVFHGWQMLEGVMPESRHAVDQSVAFMIRHLDDDKPAGAGSCTRTNIHDRQFHANRHGGPMKVVITAATFLALGTTALGAQGANSDPDKVVADGGVKVAGWTGRLDPRPASQGRKITETKFVGMGSGIHVTAGPAAIYWNPSNAPSGNYTVSATFNQTKASTHPEGYGLLVAGQNLDSANQSYVYFLVRQDGKFLINHRADDANVHKLVDWTANPAVKAIDESGKASNKLAVTVDAEKVHFLVNGTEVHSLPRSVVDSGNGHAGTTGIAGIRVNHNLDVHIDGFAVTKQ